MALVIGIANASVSRQLGSRVTATFIRENLEILRADFAEEELMNLSDVFLQFAELEERSVIALGATILQQTIESLLNVEVSESDAELLLVEP